MLKHPNGCFSHLLKRSNLDTWSGITVKSKSRTCISKTRVCSAKTEKLVTVLVPFCLVRPVQFFLRCQCELAVPLLIFKGCRAPMTVKVASSEAPFRESKAVERPDQIQAKKTRNDFSRPPTGFLRGSRALMPPLSRQRLRLYWPFIGIQPRILRPHFQSAKASSKENSARMSSLRLGAPPEFSLKQIKPAHLDRSDCVSV
jgi:hypothetical protein